MKTIHANNDYLFVIDSITVYKKTLQNGPFYVLVPL